MATKDQMLLATRLLDFGDPAVARLLEDRGWRKLSQSARIAATYDFIQNEIRFGYNKADDLTASQVLADGYGQCNTKATLFMALLRGVGIRCRLHGFTVSKALQRGLVPELIYPIAPTEILHSWVEVESEGGWLNLEGFILDKLLLESLQRSFEGVESLLGFGVGTDSLSFPAVEWRGENTYIQKSGIVRDLGTFDTPDDFYATHRQDFGPLRETIYRYGVRHWMNRRVRRIRRGDTPLVTWNTGSPSTSVERSPIL